MTVFCSYLVDGLTEGTLVSVVEPDDGSGWVKVADESGKSGLVPASYIEAAEEEVATPAAQQHYGSGKYGQ